MNRTDVTRQVDEALAQVFDPCSVAANAPLNVLDMGLVRECSVDEGGVARIVVSATSPSCVLIGSIIKGIEEQVGAVDGIRAVDVRLDRETFWTPELMTIEGRDKLDARRQGSMQRLPIRPRQWQDSARASHG